MVFRCSLAQSLQRCCARGVASRFLEQKKNRIVSLPLEGSSDSIVFIRANAPPQDACEKFILVFLSVGGHFPSGAEAARTASEKVYCGGHALGSTGRKKRKNDGRHCHTSDPLHFDKDT